MILGLRPPARARKAIAAAAAIVLVTASAAIAWRVLRPAEVVTAAATPYPANPIIPRPGALGALTAAPLIVQERLRIFADERHVWADTPPDFRYQQSPFWSYRRWPAQLVGMVVTENRPTDQGTPIAVTAWSDGALVGIDARTGEVAWETETEPLGGEYTGRRTGASTVYAPPGLFTAAGLVVVASDKTLSGYDPAAGTLRWRVNGPAAAGCAGADFTATGQYLQLDTCSRVVRRLDLSNGSALPALGDNVTQLQPLGCAVGHSECSGARLSGIGWLLTERVPVRAERLDPPDAVLAGSVAVTPAQADPVSELKAHDPVTAELRWTWSAGGGQPARVIAATAERVILLTESGDQLVALSAVTGKELSRSTATLYFEPARKIELGYVYTAGRYLIMERLTPGVSATASDTEYYAHFRPILLAAT